MKNVKKTLSLALFLWLVILPSMTMAQAEAEEEVIVTTRNMSGPRFGLTYVMGDGQLSEELEHHGLGRTISQFGWHFEHQVVPTGGGPRFLIEFIPMLAGVEYGTVIPNFTLAMGMRTPEGYEFGMGPNLTFSKNLNSEVEPRTALLMGLGKSFNYGGVSIPVNLAFATSTEGNRISLIFGYAIGKTKTSNATVKRSSDSWRLQ